MKDYIKSLAKGEFEYSDVQLDQVQPVYSEAVEDAELTGSITLKADGAFTGTAYSSDERVHISSKIKGDGECTLNYTLNTRSAIPGDIIEGVFYIITSAGEQHIPYRFEVTRKAIICDDYRVSDINSFASLAKEDMELAMRVFKQPEFRAVVLRDDMRLNALYDTFGNATDQTCALYGFLLGAGKEKYLNFDKKGKEPDDSIENQDEDTSRTIKKRIPQDPFIAEWNRVKIDLTRGYLSYRMKRNTLENWTRAAQNRIENSKLDMFYRGAPSQERAFLEYQVSLAMILSLMGKKKAAGNKLFENKDALIADRNGDGILYYASLYISTMLADVQEEIDEAGEMLSEVIDGADAPWPVILFGYHLDSSNEENASIWLARFKDAFAAGCTSPILYLEAIRIFNRQPVLLRVLNSFETQVIRFGYRYKLVESATTYRIAELVSEETVPDLTHLHCLKKLYDEYKSDEILVSMCSKMIQSNLIGPEYAIFYEQAVVRGLNITLLYEYYLMSLDKTELTQIPETVLRYFVYESGIDQNTRAYLYANVINMKETNPEIYSLYRTTMINFASKMLAEGIIDDNLIYIYRWYKDEADTSDESIAASMFRLYFTYKITLESDLPSHLTVRHGEFKTAKKTPIIGRRTFAFIMDDLRGDNQKSVLSFESSDGRIWSDKSFAYTAERVFTDNITNVPEGAECESDTFYMLYRYRMAGIRGEAPVRERYARRLLSCEGITPAFEKELRIAVYGSSDPDSVQIKGPEVKPLKGDSIQVTELEDALARMLFTRCRADEMSSVFAKLYELKPDGELTDAYKAYQSFAYIVKGEEPDINIFPLIFEKVKAKEKQLPIELAALLKHEGTNERELTLEEISIFTDILHAFIGKGYVFEFFKELNPAIEVPFFIEDKTVIEYFGIPDSEVWFDITDETGDTRRVKPKETICGIYTYPLTVFEGDYVEVNVSVSNGGEEIENRHISISHDGRSYDDITGFKKLCKVNAAMETGNETEARTAAYEYLTDLKTAREIFTAL